MTPSPLEVASGLGDALTRAGAPSLQGNRFLVHAVDPDRSAEVRRGDLRDRARRLGAFLSGQGLRPGDRLLVGSQDDTAVLVGVLACLEYGYSAAVVPFESVPPEVAHFVRLCQPAAALVDGQLAPAAQAAGIRRVLRVADPGSGGGRLVARLLGRAPVAPSAGADTFPEVLRSVEPASGPEGLPEELEALVLFTSGSTGRPKGVPIRRLALFLHARTLAREYGYGLGTRILCTLPLHHTDGLMHGALTAWLAGGEALRPVRFTLARGPELLDAAFGLRATHFVTVPTQLHLLERFASGREDAFRGGDFRFVISSAAPLDPALWQRFERRFGVRVANLYGLTETVCGGLFCGPGDATYRLGTVGFPVDCLARIVTEGGAEARTGEAGELWLSGPHLASRYLMLPGEVGDDLLHDGWFRTGDLATQDAEGSYRIVGRKKNLVISGGVNIQPEEVTAVLSALPGVADAVAFGVQDEAFGEVLVACVVSEPGGPSQGEVLAGCRAQMAPHKVPRAVAMVPALPRGATGKLDLARARDLFARARSAPSGVDGTDLAGEVLRAAASVFQLPDQPLLPSSTPAEIPRWDSFGHLAFVVELEARFAIRLSTAEILNLKSLSDAQRLVRAKTSS